MASKNEVNHPRCFQSCSENSRFPPKDVRSEKPFGIQDIGLKSNLRLGQTYLPFTERVLKKSQNSWTKNAYTVLISWSLYSLLLYKIEFYFELIQIPSSL